MRASGTHDGWSNDLPYAGCWLELRHRQTEKMRSRATLPVCSYLDILSRPRRKVNGFSKSSPLIGPAGITAHR